MNITKIDKAHILDDDKYIKHVIDIKLGNYPTFDLKHPFRQVIYWHPPKSMKNPQWDQTEQDWLEGRR